MWLPKEGKFILLFSNKISERNVGVGDHTGSPLRNNFHATKQQFAGLLPARHPGEPIPEPYPGSGVAMRQTKIYRQTSGHSNPH